MRTFDEDGTTTLAEQFNFDAVDDALSDKGNCTLSDAIEAACELDRRVFQWVYQPPCKDFEGFFIRSIIACWVFVPQLRAYSMTHMAKRFGKKKQSLGRWVDDFKKEFPELKHLQHIKTSHE